MISIMLYTWNDNHHDHLIMMIILYIHLVNCNQAVLFDKVTRDIIMEKVDTPQVSTALDTKCFESLISNEILISIQIIKTISAALEKSHHYDHR